MPKTNEHTPTPWHSYEYPQSQSVIIRDEQYTHLARVEGPITQEQAKANAAYIVKAANNFEDLVKALNIFRQPEKQLEITPMGYAIFRLDAKDIARIGAILQRIEE